MTFKWTFEICPLRNAHSNLRDALPNEVSIKLNSVAAKVWWVSLHTCDSLISIQSLFSSPFTKIQQGKSRIMMKRAKIFRGRVAGVSS